MSATDPHIEMPDRAQVESFRSMRSVDRVSAALRMTKLVRTMIQTRLRREFPDWSDEQVTQELHRRYHGRRG